MATKETKRDKAYMQSLKAERAVQNSKGKSPSFSTRERTSVVSRRKASSQYSNSTLKNVASLVTRKTTKNEKAHSKVESSFAKQRDAEDKDMARRRRLMNAKKNVNKRIK